MAIDLSKLKRKTTVEPPRIFFYAVPGFGKTTFAAQAPNCIFLPTEQGLGNLDVHAFDRPESFSDVITCLDALLSQEHKFSTLVIDTADKLELLIFEQVVEDKNKEKGLKGYASIADIGYAKGYEFAIAYWQQILNRLDALRARGLATIVLAHSLVKAFNSPTSDPYDRYRPNLHDKSASCLVDWADIVLFGNYRVFTRKEGTGTREKSKGIGEGERVIYTEERPSHWAKQRAGYRLPYELPFPDGAQWKTFEDALFGPAREEQAKKAA